MKFLRLKSDNVLVKLEPLQQKGLLHFDLDKEPIRTAVVLDVGPGKYVKVRRSGHSEEKLYREVLRPTEVQKGERVAFFIASVDTKSGKAVSFHLPEDERLIREDDILFVFEEGSSVEVSR